jgi:Raf kinase inhibitor-like YbhB/YbcL family protein
MKHIEKAIDYKQIKVSSTAFKSDEMIPAKYTCDGDNINPPLDFVHIPEEAKCLAIIVDDPDAPVGTWVHWIAWNIPVTHHIKENKVYGTEGINDFQQHHYGGPCPPSGTHHYFFKVYALDTLLNLHANTKKIQLEKAMSEHIIAFGELIGLYKRNK